MKEFLLLMGLLFSTGMGMTMLFAPWINWSWRHVVLGMFPFIVYIIISFINKVRRLHMPRIFRWVLWFALVSIIWNLAKTVNPLVTALINNYIGGTSL